MITAAWIAKQRATVEAEMAIDPDVPIRCHAPELLDLLALAEDGLAWRAEMRGTLKTRSAEE